MNRDLPTAPPHAILRTPTVWFMSFAAAIGTASIYPLQPAIADVAGTLQASISATGIALACGPVGYLMGLALLVPLVDRFPPRRVVAAQFGALAVALAINAAASDVRVLGVIVGVIGACSSVGAQLSSIAGRFAEPRRRATVLGIVTAGISGGILIGRVGGGWLSDVLGWREMLAAFGVACGCIALGAYLVLPNARGSSDKGYGATLRELPRLYVRSSTLRLAAVRGALWFFAFCTVWAGLSVALSLPPFSYSPERIGMYALAGLLGIAATRIAGGWTDRVGARRVILVGLSIAAVAAVTLTGFLSNTAVVVICLGLFDAGLFSAQVANQSSVLAVDPSAPARFNGAYMIVYFVGGSLGSAFGAAAVPGLGWPTTIGVAAAAIAGAAVITVGVGGSRGRNRRDASLRA